MTRHHPAVLQCILAGLLIVALAVGLGALFQDDSPQPEQGCQRGQTDRTDDHPCRGGETAALGAWLNLVERQPNPLEVARSNRAAPSGRTDSPPTATTLRPRACIHPRARRSGDFRRAYA